MAFESYRTEGAFQHPLVLGDTCSSDARIWRDVTCRGMRAGSRGQETARSAARNAHAAHAGMKARDIGAADSCSRSRFPSSVGKTSRATAERVYFRARETGIRGRICRHPIDRILI